MEDLEQEGIHLPHESPVESPAKSPTPETPERADPVSSDPNVEDLEQEDTHLWDEWLTQSSGMSITSETRGLTEPNAREEDGAIVVSYNPDGYQRPIDTDLPRGGPYKRDPNRIYVTAERNMGLEWLPDSLTPPALLSFYHRGRPDDYLFADFHTTHVVKRFHIGTPPGRQQVFFQVKRRGISSRYGETWVEIYDDTFMGFTIFGNTVRGSTIFGDTIYGTTVYGNTSDGTTVYGNTTRGRTFFGERWEPDELELKI